MYTRISNKKEDDGYFYYEKILNENKKEFDHIAQCLISLDYQYLTIYMDSNKLLVSDNGESISLSDVPLDNEIISSIKDLSKRLNIEYIYRLDGYVKFLFYTEEDQYSLAFTFDKSKLNCYTNIEDMGDNWYFCYIFNV
jgi:hypothetical protein